MPKKVSYIEGNWGSFFKAPEGTHPAIIVWVMELGTEMKSYKDEDPRPVSEIRLVFEIEAEQEIMKDGESTGETEDKIGLIAQNYTEVISDRSKLGAVIASVYDVKSIKEIKNLSLDKLLGLKCLIEVEYKGEKKWENIKSVSWFSKKVNYHEQVRENFYFGLEDENDFVEELLEDRAILRPFDKDRIIASPEYKALFGIESIEDQEANMKKEAETRQAVETVWEDDAKKAFE